MACFKPYRLPVMLQGRALTVLLALGWVLSLVYAQWRIGRERLV